MPPHSLRHKTVLAAPVLVPASMAVLFRLLSRRFAPRTAYNIGFAVYWLGWCIGLSPLVAWTQSCCPTSDTRATTLDRGSHLAPGPGRRRRRYPAHPEPSSCHQTGSGDDGRRRRAERRGRGVAVARRLPARVPRRRHARGGVAARSVKSRSNGPSNASRSSSRSRTDDATR